MFRKMIPITTIAVLMLTGCGETPSETAQDITATREDADQAINNAQGDVVDARQDLVRTDRNAVNEVTEAEAEMTLASAMAVATSARDTALVAAERH